MLVSAISAKNNIGYNIPNSVPHFSKFNEQIGDTSFNSLTPYSNKKNTPSDDSPIVYDSINQWKNFCEHNIVGEKLNIIA